MSVDATLSQAPKLVFGLLSFTANEKKEAVDATWYDTAGASTPPANCRGVSIKVRSGSVRIGGAAAVDAGEGQTYTAGQGFGIEDASSVAGVWIYESAGSTAVVEILCRTGGVS
jgi:hypothetical protein